MKLWAWASRTLRVGGGMGAGQGFPAHTAPGSIPRQGWMTAAYRLWRGSGAAQLSRNDSGGKGGRPPWHPLTSHPPHQGGRCLTGPSLSSSEDLDSMGAEGHTETKDTTAIILLKIKKIKEKTQRPAKAGLAFSARPLLILPVLTHQTKMLGVPPQQHHR